MLLSMGLMLIIDGSKKFDLQALELGEYKEKQKLIINL